MFIDSNLQAARNLADQARQTGDCNLVKQALVKLGRAYHTQSDGLSPAHSGFQPWYSPSVIGLSLWLSIAISHGNQENMTAYAGPSGIGVAAAVGGFFQTDLDYILSE